MSRIQWLTIFGKYDIIKEKGENRVLIFLYVICGLAFAVLTWKRLEDKETDINKMVMIFLFALFGPCGLVYEALKVLEEKVYADKQSGSNKIRFE